MVPKPYKDPALLRCSVPLQGERDPSSRSGVGRVRPVLGVGGDDAESGMQGGRRAGEGEQELAILVRSLRQVFGLVTV